MIVQFLVNNRRSEFRDNIARILSFETSNSFANGSKLEVFISTDFDGNKDHIKQATWTILPAKIVSNGISFKSGCIQPI